MSANQGLLGLLATRVYHQNWIAKDFLALRRRILKCISEVPPATVQATLETVRKSSCKPIKSGSWTFVIGHICLK